MNSFKQKIHTRCDHLLSEKISALKISLRELEDGSGNDAKSSAGDKHETARAMMQLEQEKISKQLDEALEQKNTLAKIDIKVNSPEIIKGSLVKTNKGFLFLSIALGKIIVDDVPVIVLSPLSPLGMSLAGLKTGGHTEMNGTAYLVEKIF
ncbi:MAG TPA: hypothetical protein VNY73_09690 [Bacteroidia bacterium]|jgi:hypothetical protein|nr:hypothetical protein [Bacteroidia bacterium]